MVLTSPLWLLGLLAVAAAAAWALWRPGRQLVDVGSVRLWEQALASLARSARRRTRRVTASWVLLLLGAAAGITALSGPVLRFARPARRLAVAVVPSAELAPGGGRRRLQAAAEALLSRLSPADRVQLVRPPAAGGASAWLTPQQAREELLRTPLLAAPAAELALPPHDPAAQKLVRFVPAGARLPGGPNVETVEVPVALPPTGFEHFGAVERGGGGAQLFAALRNSASAAWSGELTVRTLDADGPATWRQATSAAITIGPRGREQFVRDLPASSAVAAALGPPGGAPVAEAFLVRRAAVRRAVALIGPDEPMLRRFVDADETLRPAGDADEADVVIANGVVPPAGKPALVIAPPQPPPAWRRGPQLFAADLSGASLAADDPVMKGVAMQSVAVRRLPTWLPPDRHELKVLAAVAQGAVMLRSDGAAGPRRVYVTFELSGDNTNLAVSEAMVVFLANAMRWLAPPGRAKAVYECLSPRQAADAAGWRRVAGAAPADAGGPWPWPGIFRDEAGRLQAVSLPALAAAEAPRDARAVAETLALPPPLPAASGAALWPILAAAAMALWLAGWAARLR